MRTCTGFAHGLQMRQSVLSLFCGELHQASRAIINFGINSLLYSDAMMLYMFSWGWNEVYGVTDSCFSGVGLQKYDECGREQCHALALTFTCFLYSRDQTSDCLAKRSHAQPLALSKLYV